MFNVPSDAPQPWKSDPPTRAAHSRGDVHSCTYSAQAHAPVASSSGGGPMQPDAGDGDASPPMVTCRQDLEVIP